MNIKCLILGHKTNFMKGDITEPKPCMRKGCEFIADGIKIPDPPPMPKCKPTKVYISETELMRH